MGKLLILKKKKKIMIWTFKVPTYIFTSYIKIYSYMETRDLLCLITNLFWLYDEVYLFVSCAVSCNTHNYPDQTVVYQSLSVKQVLCGLMLVIDIVCAFQTLIEFLQ